MKNIKAFTLSEVMLVLSVIGVIAALTIPGIVQNVSKSQSVAQLRKIYSTLSQSYTMVITEDGDILAAMAGDGFTATDISFMNSFTRNMNILKNCGSAKGCFYDTKLKILNGAVESTAFDTDLNNRYGKCILSNGAMIIFNNLGTNCTGSYGTCPLPVRFVAL